MRWIHYISFITCQVIHWAYSCPSNQSNLILPLVFRHTPVSHTNACLHEQINLIKSNILKDWPASIRSMECTTPALYLPNANYHSRYWCCCPNRDFWCARAHNPIHWLIGYCLPIYNTLGMLPRQLLLSCKLILDSLLRHHNCNASNISIGNCGITSNIITITTILLLILLIPIFTHWVAHLQCAAIGPILLASEGNTPPITARLTIWQYFAHRTLWRRCHVSM